MQFSAELKETKQVKHVSLDNVYTIKLVTEDSSVMDLGKLPADTLFTVTIGYPNGRKA